MHTILNSAAQITCLYDMDIPRPDNFNECYLYEGTVWSRHTYNTLLILAQSLWNAIWRPLFGPASR